MVGVVLFADDDEVAVEDAGVDHALAFHAKCEQGVAGFSEGAAGEVIGDGEGALKIVDGFDGIAGGDGAQDGDVEGFGARD